MDKFLFLRCIYCITIIMLSSMNFITHCNALRRPIFSTRKSLSSFSRLSSTIKDKVGEPHDYVVTSFYRFHPLEEERVVHIVKTGKEIISRHPTIKGTLLVAKEGINGQFCLPVNMVSEFPEILCTIDADLFAPVKLNVGLPFSSQALLTDAFPFKKLLVKKKKEILTDNIADLNWNDAGPEVSAAAWHQELKSAFSSSSSSSSSKDVSTEHIITANNDVPILLDCRNGYESDIGTFAGAIPLNTDRFSETWEKLETMLQNVPANRRILTFCTGGIRCVKVNAYLKQKLGFQNIGRLEHGIIAYEKWVQQENPKSEKSETNQDNNNANNNAKNDFVNNDIDENKNCEESMFRGKNFLFDRRRLMDDIASAASSSSAPSSTTTTIVDTEEEKVH